MKNLLLLSILAGLALCCAADELPELGDSSQQAMSPQQERALGESIMLQIRADKDYVDDPEISDYLAEIGNRLVAVTVDARQPFEFFAVADPSINAFALPGGFVGVHSGLMLMAQTESELASVLAHEVSHVTQRHLARMIAAQQRAGIASMAALAIAILAARSNSDASAAAIAAAQAGAIQSQLNFTREHEREADRIGLQTLEKSGFDVHAMPTFFERLQKSTRVYDTNAPSYLRTHPLTFERIADIQNRVDKTPFRLVPDSLDFHLVRAKLKAMDGRPRDAVDYFETIFREKRYSSEAAARYGLALSQLRAGNLAQAKIEGNALANLPDRHPMIDALLADIRSQSGDAKGALALYESSLRKYPGKRALVAGYATALLTSGRPLDAAEFLRVKIENGMGDARNYELQARSYAAAGKRLAQHHALAEALVLKGNLSAAVEQLQLAVASKDGDFYQRSIVESRLRELRARDLEEKKKAKQQQ
jgi:predicted Zn-dependent protease